MDQLQDSNIQYYLDNEQQLRLFREQQLTTRKAEDLARWLAGGNLSLADQLRFDELTDTITTNLDERAALQTELSALQLITTLTPTQQTRFNALPRLINHNILETHPLTIERDNIDNNLRTLPQSYTTETGTRGINSFATRAFNSRLENGWELIFQTYIPPPRNQRGGIWRYEIRKKNIPVATGSLRTARQAEDSHILPIFATIQEHHDNIARIEAERNTVANLHVQSEIDRINLEYEAIWDLETSTYETQFTDRLAQVGEIGQIDTMDSLSAQLLVDQSVNTLHSLRYDDLITNIERRRNISDRLRRHPDRYPDGLTWTSTVGNTFTMFSSLSQGQIRVLQQRISALRFDQARELSHRQFQQNYPGIVLGGSWYRNWRRNPVGRSLSTAYENELNRRALQRQRASEVAIAQARTDAITFRARNQGIVRSFEIQRQLNDVAFAAEIIQTYGTSIPSVTRLPNSNQVRLTSASGQVFLFSLTPSPPPITPTQQTRLDSLPHIIQNKQSEATALQEELTILQTSSTLTPPQQTRLAELQRQIVTNRQSLTTHNQEISDLRALTLSPIDLRRHVTLTSQVATQYQQILDSQIELQTLQTSSTLTPTQQTRLAELQRQVTTNRQSLIATTHQISDLYIQSQTTQQTRLAELPNLITTQQTILDTFQTELTTLSNIRPSTQQRTRTTQITSSIAQAYLKIASLEREHANINILHHTPSLSYIPNPALVSVTTAPPKIPLPSSADSDTAKPYAILNPTTLVPYHQDLFDVPESQRPDLETFTYLKNNRNKVIFLPATSQQQQQPSEIPHDLTVLQANKNQQNYFHRITTAKNWVQALKIRQDELSLKSYASTYNVWAVYNSPIKLSSSLLVPAPPPKPEVENPLLSPQTQILLDRYSITDVRGKTRTFIHKESADKFIQRTAEYLLDLEITGYTVHYKGKDRTFKTEESADRFIQRFSEPEITGYTVPYKGKDRTFKTEESADKFIARLPEEYLYPVYDPKTKLTTVWTNELASMWHRRSITHAQKHPLDFLEKEIVNIVPYLDGVNKKGIQNTYPTEEQLSKEIPIYESKPYYAESGEATQFPLWTTILTFLPIPASGIATKLAIKGLSRATKFTMSIIKNTKNKPNKITKEKTTVLIPKPNKITKEKTTDPKPNHPYVQKHVHTDLKTKKKTTHISYEKPLPIIRERIMINPLSTPVNFQLKSSFDKTNKMSYEAWLRANPKPNHPYVQKHVHTDLKTKKKTTHISYEKPLPIIRERIMINPLSTPVNFQLKSSFDKTNKMSHEAWLRANPKPNHPYVQKYVHTDLKNKKENNPYLLRKATPNHKREDNDQSSEYTSKLSTQIIIR